MPSSCSGEAVVGYGLGGLAIHQLGFITHMGDQLAHRRQTGLKAATWPTSSLTLPSGAVRSRAGVILPAPVDGAQRSQQQGDQGSDGGEAYQQHYQGYAYLAPELLVQRVGEAPPCPAPEAAPSHCPEWRIWSAVWPGCPTAAHPSSGSATDRRDSRRQREWPTEALSTWAGSLWAMTAPARSVRMAKPSAGSFNWLTVFSTLSMVMVLRHHLVGHRHGDGDHQLAGCGQYRGLW